MNRIFIHVIAIIAVGVGVGLIARSMRGPSGNSHGEMATVGEAGFSSGMQSAATSPGDAEWLSEFELTERSGKEVSSEDLEGRPYVVSFFFSTCPSTCVTQNQKLRQLQAEFEDQGVRFLSITVDPETDSPEVLSEYARRFGADEDQWLFLTGDLMYIRRVGAEVFRLPVDKRFHTEKFVLVDTQGKIAGYYEWTQPQQYEQLKDDIRDQLAATSGEAGEEKT